MIAIVCVAYNSFTLELGDSIFRSPQTDVQLYLFTHSKDQVTVREVKQTVAKYSDKLTLFDYQSNRGLARSWNDGIYTAYTEGAEAIIVVNDDVLFSKGDIENMARQSIDSDNHIIMSKGKHEQYGEVPGHGYTCFAITKVAIETIGYFDQNLWPAYFEDNDYDYRARLAGFTHDVCQGTNVYHYGSRSIQMSPLLKMQNHSTFQANRAYYMKKWGNEPHKEIFKVPFNNSKYGFRISAEARGNPYPDHFRPIPERLI